MGKLYPQTDNSPIDDNTKVLDMARNPVMENESGDYDAAVSLSNMKNPSSMGITIVLKKGISDIVVSGEYAFYIPIDFDTAKARGTDVSAWEMFVKKPALWKRQVYRYEIHINLDENKIIKKEIENGMRIHVYSSYQFKSEERIVTISLINGNTADTDQENQAKSTAFQTRICISSSTNETIFANVDQRSSVTADNEYSELDLLYSDYQCYGQGHGCSVEWDLTDAIPKWVSSSFFPL
jgi:hypothetical protein